MIDVPTIHWILMKQDRSLSPGIRKGDVHTSLPYYYRDLGYNFGVEKGEANSTLRMIRNFMETRKIESPYMTTEEIRDLNRSIEYAVLFAKNSKRHSMTSIFKKVNE
jgi:hypothetical protein